MERYALQLLRCYLGDELDPEIEIKMLQDGDPGLGLWQSDSCW